MLDPNLPRVTPGFGGPATRMPPRIRMGNYNRARLPETTLREIWDWMNDLGAAAGAECPRQGGCPRRDGATYTIEVANSGVKGKGVDGRGRHGVAGAARGREGREDDRRRLSGRAPDEEAKADVAVWKVASMPAAAQQTLTMTLAQPAPQLRGVITWDTPKVKADRRWTSPIRRPAAAAAAAPDSPLAGR